MRHKASRDVVEGVMRHATRQGGMEVVMFGNHPCNDGFERSAGMAPDIVVADASLMGSAGRALLSAPSIRGAVFCGAPPRRHLPWPHVSLVSDDAAIGAAAAALFAGKGIRDFAYLGAPEDNPWSEARKRSFAEALAGMGVKVADYGVVAKRPDWRRERKRMAAWVLSLPKPCGILVAYDQRAHHLVGVCRDARIAVPRQIQILGVDNEEYICENETPSISSIALDFRVAAGEAVEMLVAYLEHGKPMPERVLAPVARVVERLSTSDLSRTGERVNRARDYIRRNATAGIGPADVSRHVGGTMRLLETAFKEVLGWTVTAELREVRLREAARLLETTNAPVGEIAPLIGFGTRGGLMNAFRARYGMSMVEWRARNGVRRNS